MGTPPRVVAALRGISGPNSRPGMNTEVLIGNRTIQTLFSV
jgi:hypothetical protein